MLTGINILLLLFVSRLDYDPGPEIKGLLN